MVLLKYKPNDLGFRLNGLILIIPIILISALVNRIVSPQSLTCLLYTSDAADERSSVDLGGRRIIKKKNNIDEDTHGSPKHHTLQP